MVNELKPETLIVEFTHQVATVTLNRPDVRNAFNETMIAELTGWPGPWPGPTTARCYRRRRRQASATAWRRGRSSRRSPKARQP